MEPILLNSPIYLPQEDQGLKIADIGLLHDEELNDQGIPCSLNSASSCHNKELEGDGNLLQTPDSASSEISRIQCPNDASDAAIRQDFGNCDLGGEVEGLKRQANALWRRMNKVSKVYGETLFLKRGAAEISNREEELQWKEEVIMELENTVAKLRGVVDRLEEVKKREIGKREMGDSLAISTSKVGHGNGEISITELGQPPPPDLVGFFNEGENLTGDYRQLRIEHQELQTEPEQQEKEWYADADELIHLQWVNGA
ncbi:hypothetical protein ACLOJK_031736 [Asimina triloba]